jgi:hypothetical protein
MKLKSAKYVGNFIKNRIDGNGRLIREDGNEFKGNFTDKIQNGKRHIYCENE